MNFICIAHTPVEVGQVVKFVASHSGDHAAYLVKIADGSNPQDYLGVALENAEPRKAFMVEADYEQVAAWHAQFYEQERD